MSRAREDICPVCEESFDDCEEGGCPEAEIRAEVLRERLRKWRQDQRDEEAAMTVAMAAFSDGRKP